MKNDSSIDVLRILAAFAVVTIHVSSIYLAKDATVSNSFWWVSNIFNSLSRWSVPVFIMISGSLLINPKSFEDTNLFFKKRVKRILIPLVFWSLFFIIFNIFITGFFTINDTIGRLYIGEPYYHLWYLYLIVGIYIVTPVISLAYAKFTRKERIKIIIGMFIAAAIESMWSKYFGQSNQFFLFKFLPYLGYFMIGKEIAASNTPFNKYTYFVVWLLASSLIILLTGLFRYLDFKVITYFYDYLNPLVILQSLSFYLFIKKLMSNKNLSERLKDTLARLSMLSLGIYIIHPIFIEIGPKKINSSDFLLSFLMVSIFTICVFVLSGIITYVLTKIPLLRKLV